MEVQTIEYCCDPVLVEPLEEAEAETLAAGFRVLADPTRPVAELDRQRPRREMCACDVTAPVGRSQPTVSHHLSILTDAGLLAREQRGKWAWFRVVPERLAVLRDAHSGLTSPQRSGVTPSSASSRRTRTRAGHGSAGPRLGRARPDRAPPSSSYRFPEVRAGVAASHGDDHVGGPHDLVGPRPGDSPAMSIPASAITATAASLD